MCLTNVTRASPFIRYGLSHHLWKAPSMIRSPINPWTQSIRQLRHHGSRAARGSSKTGLDKAFLLSLSLPSLFNFKKTARLTRDDIASVDQADIPKEVFIDDLKLKKKLRQSRLVALVVELWSWTRTVVRSWRLILTFAPLIVTYPLTYLSAHFYHVWLRLLLFACERSGPTLVKFGQWASTRRDLFSKEFCDRFSKLHRRTNPHPWHYSRKKLEKAFGKNWRDVLVRIDDKNQPLGSGCVAQVYKAYMPSEMVVDDAVLEEILECIDDSATSDDGQ